jgi:hypothetical protein
MLTPRLVKRQHRALSHPATIHADFKESPRPGQAPPTTFPYWMVWNPKFSYPRFRHATEADSWTEARRLADSYPDRKFYVVRIEGCVETTTPAGEAAQRELAPSR